MEELVMKCIKILTDLDFGLDIKESDNPRIRYGTRGIIFNDNNEIAILNKNGYKLVGGGIDENEDPIFAFKREVLEEAGCKIDKKVIIYYKLKGLVSQCRFTRIIF